LFKQIDDSGHGGVEKEIVEIKFQSSAYGLAMRDIKSGKRAIQLIDMSKSCVFTYIKILSNMERVSVHEENFVTDMFINYLQANDFKSVTKKVLLMHNIKLGSNRNEKVQTIVESLNHLLLLN
jgi:hypothetical protein